MPDFFSFPPEMTTADDSLLIFVSTLCQFGGTLILIRHGNWTKSFIEIFQLGIAAAVTALHLIFVSYVLIWRSKRQVGNKLSTTISTFALAISVAVALVINLGAGQNTIENLWVSGLFGLAACCIVELSRAESGLLIVIMLPVMLEILGNKGHLFWRIGFGILASALILLMFDREEYWVTLKEAEDLRNKEAADEAKKIKTQFEQASKLRNEQTTQGQGHPVLYHHPWNEQTPASKLVMNVGSILLPLWILVFLCSWSRD